MRAHTATAQHPAVAVGELAAHLFARQRPAVARVAQRVPRVEQRLLDPRRREVEHLADLGAGDPLSSRSTSAARWRSGRSARSAGAVAAPPARSTRSSIAPATAAVSSSAVSDVLSKDRDRLVVGDPEQPGSEIEVASLVLKRRKRARDGVLQRVLRVLFVAHDRPAVAIQRLVMALVDGGEGRRVRRRRPANGGLGTGRSRRLTGTAVMRGSPKRLDPNCRARNCHPSFRRGIALSSRWRSTINAFPTCSTRDDVPDPMTALEAVTELRHELDLART